jgi:hypothetical protein
MASSRASNSASEASSPGDVDMPDAQAGATRGAAVKNGYFKDVSSLHHLMEARSARVFCKGGIFSDTFGMQEPLDTPDYTVTSYATGVLQLLTKSQDSDTNPNTTASSVAGDAPRVDGRMRRSEAIQLRKSVFGKKLNKLDESKVRFDLYK